MTSMVGPDNQADPNDSHADIEFLSRWKAKEVCSILTKEIDKDTEESITNQEGAEHNPSWWMHVADQEQGRDQ